MTAARAVLAAAARFALAAVLVAVSLAAALWTAYGPQGPWTLAWLAVMFVVVAGAVLGICALQPEDRDPGPEPLPAAQMEAARRLAAETLEDDHLAIERHAWRAVHGEGGGRG